MSRDETTSTNFGSISNIFHFMPFTPPLATRTYACTMQICHSPERNFVYAAQIFHMGISEGVFVFCCFLSLVLALDYFMCTDIPNKVDPKKEKKYHRGFATTREIEAISTWSSQVKPQFPPQLTYTGDPAGRSE